MFDNNVAVPLAEIFINTTRRINQIKVKALIGSVLPARLNEVYPFTKKIGVIYSGNNHVTLHKTSEPLTLLALIT